MQYALQVQKLSTHLGAETFKQPRTTASKTDGSSTICAPVTPILAQKLLMASGGKPLRLKAVRVKSLGSSQSLHILASMSLPIFLFETTA